MPNLLELCQTKDFFLLFQMDWGSHHSFHFEIVCPFFVFDTVVSAFYKFTIGESHGFLCHVKVILVVMQDYMNFQCHVQLEVFKKIFNIH